MGAKLVLKILTGCFLALAALITIVGSVLISNIERLQPFQVHIVIGFALAGLALLLGGRCKLKAAAGAGGEPDLRHTLIDPDRPLAFFRRMDFWGGVLTVCALPIFLLSSSQIRAKDQSHPKPAGPLRQAAVVAPPVAFPPMQLTGIVWNGEKSTAVINGRTLQVGDMFAGVQVVAIGSNEVTVELSGSTRLIKLD